MEASGRLLLKEVLDEFGACLASCSKDGIRSRRDRARILSVREMEHLSPVFPKARRGLFKEEMVSPAVHTYLPVPTPSAGNVMPARLVCIHWNPTKSR